MNLLHMENLSVQSPGNRLWICSVQTNTKDRKEHISVTNPHGAIVIIAEIS